MKRKLMILAAALLLATGGTVSGAEGYMMVWDAGLGRLPHELSPMWQWYSPTSGEQATIESGY